jgi:hypothetical protein
MPSERAQPGPLTAPQFLAALRTFVGAHGGPCYRNWSPETLDDYFRFHLVHHTLAWCQDARGLCGVMVAWQTTSARLDAVCPSGNVVFDWTAPAPNGDVVWVADVVATAPGAWLALARCFVKRYPHWVNLPIYTYRDGRRHQLPVARILKQATLNLQTMPGGN